MNIRHHNRPLDTYLFYGYRLFAREKRTKENLIKCAKEDEEAGPQLLVRPNF